MLASSSPEVSPSGHREAVAYRPAIDGLRAIAVLAVVIFHLSRSWLPGGFIGVDIFFVISGYLITSVLLRDYEGEGISLGRFYQRRIARLLPAFLAMSVATLVAARFIYSDQDLASAGATLGAAALSVANLKFLLQGNYFVMSPDAQPFLHCWSLSVEEQFYLIFPGLLLLLPRAARRYKCQLFTVGCGVSLLACIVVTQLNPPWAFYLLPTRAWELLAGSVLAVRSANAASTKSGFAKLLPLAGLALIVVSYFAIHEGPSFPGVLATLPVLGTAFIIGSEGVPSQGAERFLSWKPLTLVGRMSYSLYLWHWPIFSLVDYRYYLATPVFRLCLKILISVVATGICFLLVERPLRLRLNVPKNRGFAFAALAISLALLLPASVLTRKGNYLNAESGDVRSGGIELNSSAHGGSMVLMGDSNGSMYGKLALDVATAANLKLNIISVAAGEPLPRSSGPNPELWNDSLAFVRQTKPDVVIFACRWRAKLNGNPDRLALALSQLRPIAGRIILLTQPPEMPVLATREGLRQGIRPPFFEESEERAERIRQNEYVKSLAGNGVQVIDVEPFFTAPDGSISFADESGRQIYQDAEHLSVVGARLIMPQLARTVLERTP